MFGQFGAEVRSIVAAEPEIAFGYGGIGTADHFKFEVGDDVGERDGGMLARKARLP